MIYKRNNEVMIITDYKAILVEKKENNEISAVSGCFSADTSVTIKWIKIDVSTFISCKHQ